MTRDDIIRMAQEAGFNQILATIAGADVWIDDGFYVKEMERFAALVAAAEREACAKACERLEKSFAILGEEFEYAPRIPTAEDFAEYIRARGDI